MRRLLLLAASALLLALPAKAQFQPAATPGIMIPNSDSSEDIIRVFNYSFGHATFGSTNCDLYVCSWSNQPYALKRDFYYKRTLADDPTTILDQGLVAVPNADVIYGAVIINKPNAPSQFCVAVVYSMVSGGGGIAFFEWTSSGLVLMNQYTQTFASPDFITSMRIDAIDLSYYTVVYTVNSNNNMYAFGGDVLGTYYPLVGSVKQISGNITSGTGFLPDVAMTKLNNPPAYLLPTGIKLYFSYISPDKENCLVSYLGFGQLMGGVSPMGLNYEWTVPQLTQLTLGCTPTPIYYPRYRFSRGPIIDAPDFGNDSWAVIVEQDQTIMANNCLPTNRVKLQVNASYKFNGGSIQDKVLNDASLPGIPMAAKMSENINSPYTNDLMISQPAVAFSPLSPQTINFAWGITQQNSAMGGAYDYLGMDFDPVSNTSIGAPYRIIDQNPALVTYGGRSISFSGNSVNPPNDLYTVFSGSINNPGRQEMYQKHPKWADIAATGYKPTNIEAIGQNKIGLKAIPNPFEHSFILSIAAAYQHDILNMKMTDILGRKIFSTNGNIERINQSLHQFLSGHKNLDSGLYFLQLTSSKDGNASTLKIIKQ